MTSAMPMSLKRTISENRIGCNPHWAGYAQHKREHRIENYNLYGKRIYSVSHRKLEACSRHLTNVHKHISSLPVEWS